MNEDGKNNNSNIINNEIIQQYNKPKCITCTKMNKYYFFPFITAIFITIRDIMINIIIKENYKNEEISFYFIYAAHISIFLAVGGIIYFLLDIRQFIEKRKTDLFLMKETLQSKIMRKKSKLKIFLILFLMSISFAVYVTTVCLSNFHINIEKRQYTIFLIAFLSLLILKKEIYRHQKFSLLLAFCGFLLLTIVAALKIRKEDLLSNLFSLIGTIFYSLHYLYLKYLQTECNISIYFSYMIVGSFSLIISIIGYKISSNHSISVFFKQIKENYLIPHFVIFIVSGITVETFVGLTIFYFSVMHFVLSSFISPILLFIYNISTKNDDNKVYAIILSIIGYLIELFSILIYNEIIVLNVCDLNKYTVKGLADRGRLESSLSENDENGIIRLTTFEIDDINNDSNDKSSIEMKTI